MKVSSRRRLVSAGMPRINGACDRPRGTHRPQRERASERERERERERDRESETERE